MLKERVLVLLLICYVKSAFGKLVLQVSNYMISMSTTCVLQPNGNIVRVILICLLKKSKDGSKVLMKH